MQCDQTMLYEQSHICGLKPEVGCQCVSPEKSGSAGMGSLKGMPGFPQYGVWSGNYTWKSGPIMDKEF